MMILQKVSFIFFRNPVLKKYQPVGSKSLGTSVSKEVTLRKFLVSSAKSEVLCRVDVLNVEDPGTFVALSAQRDSPAPATSSDFGAGNMASYAPLCSENCNNRIRSLKIMKISTL